MACVRRYNGIVYYKSSLMNLLYLGTVLKSRDGLLHTSYMLYVTQICAIVKLSILVL